MGFALPLGDVASGGDLVAATYLLLCYVTAATPEGHSQGVRAGDVSAAPQVMAQHTSAAWDTFAAGVFLGVGLRPEVRWC